MIRSSSFSPYQQGAKTTQTARGATELLRGHDKIAQLFAYGDTLDFAAKGLCSDSPDMFNACTVLQFESDELLLSVPNAALAAKLKQKLPKLKDSLVQLNWQITAIRLKVQVVDHIKKPTPGKLISLPGRALSSLSALDQGLEQSPRNAALKMAIATMINRHRKPD